MHPFEQDPTIVTTRRRKPGRIATAATLLVFGAVLGVGASPVRAGGLLEEPCFATCGQYRWFLRKSAEVRENAACCIGFIRKAKVKEERALKLYEAARDPANRDAASDLVREANRQIGARDRQIRKFIDCVNGVIRALASAQRGLDPTADYAAACGVTLSCEGDLGVAP